MRSNRRVCEAEFFERSRLFGDGAFHSQTLNTGSAEKALNATGMAENVFHIRWFSDGAAMADHQDFRIGGYGGIPNRLHPQRRLLQTQSGPCSDAAVRRQAHM